MSTTALDTRTSSLGPRVRDATTSTAALAQWPGCSVADDGVGVQWCPVIATVRPRQLTCARRSRCGHRGGFWHRAKPALCYTVFGGPAGGPTGTRDPDRFRAGLRGVGTGPAFETRR